MGRTVAGLIVIVSLVAGCDDSSTPTAADTVTRDQLAGAWTLVSIQPTGQAAQSTPASAVYTLMFAEDRLSTRIDCNTCSGPVTLAGKTLTAGPALACTRAACPTTMFGDAYTTMLSGEHTISLSDRDLVLSSPRGVLRLRRSPTGT